MHHVAVLVLLLLAWQPAFGQPKAIIVIRHGEKPDDPEELHLSKEGVARSKKLVAFFTKDKHAIKHGLPTVLIASHPTQRGHGQRPRETLEPLAAKLKLEIETPFESRDYAKLAYVLTTDARYQGKVVVICWVHEHLPALAAALGVMPEPSKWKDSDYDTAYVITYPEGKAHLKVIAENIR
ncbi:MAG: hypothetical protein EBS05_19475 [Proteobacteria bacterium]|nr:hypothetical protein [Pseudomonadota bacterium]